MASLTYPMYAAGTDLWIYDLSLFTVSNFQQSMCHGRLLIDETELGVKPSNSLVQMKSIIGIIRDALQNITLRLLYAVIQGELRTCMQVGTTVAVSHRIVPFRMTIYR